MSWALCPRPFSGAMGGKMIFILALRFLGAPKHHVDVFGCFCFTHVSDAWIWQFFRDHRPTRCPCRYLRPNSHRSCQGRTVTALGVTSRLRSVHIHWVSRWQRGLVVHHCRTTQEGLSLPTSMLLRLAGDVGRCQRR
jgi:hypothetical protein